MNAQDKTTKFEAGKVYQARAIGDWESVSEIKVVKVTAKMMTFEHNGETMRRKIDQRENCQRVQVSAGRSAYSNHIVEEESVEVKSNEKEIVELEIEAVKDVVVSKAADEMEELDVVIDRQEAAEESALDEYSDKEILITMHCPVKGHKVARLVSMSMFAVPCYDAAEDWETDEITEDEGKRVELIKRWIRERANRQHDSAIEFLKYEIVEEGTLSEYHLNWQFKLEAEKHDCEPAAEVAAEAVLDIQVPDGFESKLMSNEKFLPSCEKKTTVPVGEWSLVGQPEIDCTRSEIIIVAYDKSEGKHVYLSAGETLFDVSDWEKSEDASYVTSEEERVALIKEFLADYTDEGDENPECIPLSPLDFVSYEIAPLGTLSAREYKNRVEEAMASVEVQPKCKEHESDNNQSTRSIVAALKESNQDFEYYPTTQKMLDCIHRDMRKGVDQKSYSVLEVGAGTAFAGKFLAEGGRVFAIEKSEILRASWPCDVIPVGTDFDNLSMIGIKADVCFCNPPYSTYEAWAARTINEFSGGRIYLVIPQRWENSDLIKLAIEDRKASSKVIFSGDFLEAERSARARVDIVCIDLRQGEYGSRRFTKVDPFDLWYEKEFKREPEQARDEQKINIDIDESSQVVAGESYIERISSLYSAELNTLQQAFQSINGLSGKVFKLLNLSRGTLCEALKVEISGIRAKYWNELFKKYKPISSRLTSHGLKCLRDQFSAQKYIDFTVDNILAATVWAIKYANEMNNEQLEVFVLQLFDKANIINYKSNQRTFEKEDWRYSRHEEAKSCSHYGFDYRIVLDRVMPFPYREGFSFSYDYPNGLSKMGHDLVNDLLVISRNLGYESDGVTSYHHDWNPGNKKNFYLKNGDTAFTVKGYIKGTMHFQINQEIMRAMNVEFGRLKGWIKDKRQAAEELGISEAEAEKAWGSLASLMPPVPSLMLCM